MKCKDCPKLYQDHDFYFAGCSYFKILKTYNRCSLTKEEINLEDECKNENKILENK